MSALLTARHIHHGSNRHRRLHDVSLRLDAGDRLALLGINGAGKSTLLQILAGALAPRRGEVRLAGRSLYRSANPDRRRIGYLPQTSTHYPELTVQENLAWSGRLQGIPATRLGRLIDDMLTQVGLEPQRRRLAGRLSAGMQQRLGLAQALIHQPEILILDEPTANLDPLQTTRLRELIAQHAGTRALVLATHLLDDIHALCDRVLVLDQGRARGEHAISETSDLLSLIGDAVETRV